MTHTPNHTAAHTEACHAGGHGGKEASGVDRDSLISGEVCGDAVPWSADITSLEFLAGSGYPENGGKRVREMILATRHEHAPSSNDARLMVDIDLSVLGQPSPVFDTYEKNIRAEYYRVPEEEYRSGRARVLRGFLERQTIYSTERFKERYGVQARVNLENALRALGFLRWRLLLSRYHGRITCCAETRGERIALPLFFTVQGNHPAHVSPDCGMLCAGAAYALPVSISSGTVKQGGSCLGLHYASGLSRPPP